MIRQLTPSGALHAPPHLDATTVTVTQRLVEDGAPVYRFDAVAELIDAHGTETEAIAHSDGYLRYPPTGVTDERGGIVAWIDDAPPTGQDAAAPAPRTPGDVTYLTSTWPGLPYGETERDDEVSHLALLIEAILRAASLLTDSGGNNNRSGSERADIVVTVDAPAGHIVTIPAAHTLSAAGLARALDTPVEPPDGAAENSFRIQLFLAPTTGAVHLPLPANIQIAVAVSEPADTVVAVADDPGSTSIAVRRRNTVVLAYRHTTATTRQVSAFSKDIAERMRHPHFPPRGYPDARSRHRTHPA